MHRPSSSWRRGVGIGLVVVSVLLCAVGVVAPRPAQAAQGADVTKLLSQYRARLGPLFDIKADVRLANQQVKDATSDLSQAQTARNLARAALTEALLQMRAVSIELYMQSAGSTFDPTSAEDANMFEKVAAMTSARWEAAREKVDSTERAVGAAQRNLARVQRTLDTQQARYDQAQAKVDAQSEDLARLLADKHVDFNVAAFSIYTAVAETLSGESSQCHLSAATLAGVARVVSSHGNGVDSTGDVRTPIVSPGVAATVSTEDLLAAASIPGVARGVVQTPSFGPGPGGEGESVVRLADTDNGEFDTDSTQDRMVGPYHLLPATWTQHGRDGNQDGYTDPQNLADAALTVGAQLCQSGDLSEWATLEAALRTYKDSDEFVTQVAGHARRYSGIGALGFGYVPARPGMPDPLAPPRYESTPELVGGDIDAMLTWAASRVGTPYSQCIGRAQDPECPEDTNRFGNGFFDCSGFVSAAYAAIGVNIPTTTMAMEADPYFMSFKVSARVDPEQMRPGDLLLMDGHVAMYYGLGQVIHATGPALVIQDIPARFYSDVFAVLRPLL